MNPTVGKRPVRERRPPDPSRWLDDAYETHRNNFGVLRFVLATAVIWSHSYALLARAGDPVWLLSRQTDAGSLAVDGFFVLSGFLVTQSWMQQPNVRAFAFKRFLRLIPALGVAIVFGAFVIGPLGTTLALPDYLKSAGPWLHFLGVPLNRYLFIPSCFTTNPVPFILNTPLWSLRYEILCYAMVGLLGELCGRRIGIATLILFVASWLAYVSLPASISALSIPSQSTRLLACFSAGMILFVFRRRVPIRPRYAILAAAIIATTVVTGGLRSTLPWAGAYLLIYFACLKNLGLENFCRYGDFSYGLYIFACPIQQLTLYYLGPHLPVSVFFALAYLPTLGLAALSWHFVEAPALMLKKTFAPRVPRHESAPSRAPVPRPA